MAPSLVYYGSGFLAGVWEGLRGILWFVPLLVPFRRVGGSLFEVRVISFPTNHQLGWQISLASEPRFHWAVSFICHIPFYFIFYSTDLIVLRLIVGLLNPFVVFDVL